MIEAVFLLARLLPLIEQQLWDRLNLVHSTPRVDDFGGAEQRESSQWLGRFTAFRERTEDRGG